MAYFNRINATGFGDPKPEAAPKKQPKPIAKHSKKGAALNKEYLTGREIFLSLPENQKCFVEGCSKKADTIEHTKGRKGYADKDARENDIPLLLDERFWQPCCGEHNLEFENNPELSKKYQLSQIHEGKKL